MAEAGGKRRIEIIPVLDLMGGTVVRGIGGDRARYRPIETPLSPSPDPLAVLSGLLNLAPFETVYIADLDAIMDGRPQASVLAALLEAFPNVTFWIDAGFRNAQGIDRLRSRVLGAEGKGAADRRGAFVPVLGSETLDDARTVQEARRDGEVVLSLDFGAEGYRGPEAVLQDTAIWPKSLIVMTLAKVGARGGPDLDRVAAIVSKAQNQRIIAAGGVRNEDDLRALEAAGTHGVLIASALHAGALHFHKIKGCVS